MDLSNENLPKMDKMYASTGIIHNYIMPTI